MPDKGKSWFLNRKKFYFQNGPHKIHAISYQFDQIFMFMAENVVWPRNCFHFLCNFPQHNNHYLKSDTIFPASILESPWTAFHSHRIFKSNFNTMENWEELNSVCTPQCFTESSIYKIFFCCVHKERKLKREGNGFKFSQTILQYVLCKVLENFFLLLSLMLNIVIL